MYNKGTDPRGWQYSYKAKKFALTLIFYSPRTYEYIRGVFSLPHTNSSTKKSSSINREPGFFVDLFQCLKARIDQNSFHKECSLLCDAMSIKLSACNNHFTGIYDVMLIMLKALLFPFAKEALVFILVNFGGHWKYPVRFFLTNKVNTDYLIVCYPELLSYVLGAVSMYDVLQWMVLQSILSP